MGKMAKLNAIDVAKKQVDSNMFIPEDLIEEEV